MNKFWILLLVASVSCNTIDVYEKTKMFPAHNWAAAEKPTFAFDIKDTTTLYNIFLVIRHHDAYQYNNIWIDVSMQGPSDTLQVKREFILGNNAQGWLGSGMDDIFEHRIPFNNKPAAFKTGTYTFTLKQAMREDPLEEILNVGIRVEKAK